MRVSSKGEYLLGVYLINRSAYYDCDMEMAIYINKEGELRYYYWLEILIPKFMEVIL